MRARVRLFHPTRARLKILSLFLLELDSGRKRQSEATYRVNEERDRENEGPTETADNLIREHPEAD